MRLNASSASMVQQTKQGQQHARGAVMIQSTMPMRVKAKATSMNGKPRRKPRGLQSSHIFADSLLLCSPCDRDHKTDSSSAACFLKSSNSTRTRSFQDSKSLATSSGTWFAPLVAVLLPSRVIQWAKTKLLWISQTLSLSVSHTHTHTQKQALRLDNLLTTETCRALTFLYQEKGKFSQIW
jgi:hypothetical protein